MHSDRLVTVWVMLVWVMLVCVCVCVGERWKSGVRWVSDSNGDWKGPHEHGAP